MLNLCLALPLLLPAQQIRLATFNCEFLVYERVHIKYGAPFDLSGMNPNDSLQWTQDDYRKPKMQAAIDSVAAQIAAIDADIIGLTEVGDQEDLDQLLSALKRIASEYPYSALCKSTDTFTKQHVALLSRFPLSNIQPSFPDEAIYFLESDRDEVAIARNGKILRATAEGPGGDLHVFLMHLKSERGGEESDNQRLAQAELARRVILPDIMAERAVVVMGDLNSERRHPVLLRVRGFDDIFPELIQTGDDYFFDDYSIRHTYNYKGNREQIDHILLSLPMRKFYKIKSSILASPSEFVSDHHAFIVDLEVR